MSKLNDLIAQLCPDGVPYRKLLDVADVLYGAPFNAKQFNNDSEGMPLIRIRDIMRGYTETFYTGEYDDKYIIHKGDILIGMDGDFNIGKWKSDDALLNQRTLKIKHGETNEVIDGYLYHLLGPILKSVNDKIQASTVKHLTAQWMKRIEIPLPPLPVQSEVVRILDAFTELEAELEAELAGRKEQYEYYRDRLLDEKNLEAMDGKPVETKKLDEVAEIKRGERITKKDLIADGKYAVMSGGRDFFGRYNSYNRNENTITIAQYGSAGYVNYIKEKFWANDVCYCAFPLSCINNRYLYHVLKNNQDLLYKMTTKAIPDHLPKDRLINMELPVPSLATQKRIVDILDRFDTLTTSLSDGIPAEIAMRREQYEYYRARLLDFPRLPEDSDSDNE